MFDSNFLAQQDTLGYCTEFFTLIINDLEFWF